MIAWYPSQSSLKDPAVAPKQELGHSYRCHKKPHNEDRVGERCPANMSEGRLAVPLSNTILSLSSDVFNLKGGEGRHPPATFAFVYRHPRQRHLITMEIGGGMQSLKRLRWLSGG